MASRLNAKDAAALVVQKRTEAEERARQLARQEQLRKEEAERKARLLAIEEQLKKEEALKAQRHWNSQAKKLLEAALNGESFLDFHGPLYDPQQLIDRGFTVLHLDRTKFNIDAEESESVSKLEHEQELGKLPKIEQELNHKVEEFLELLGQQEIFKDIETTKQMVVKEFRKRLDSYFEDIYQGQSFDDALFDELFDGKLYVYRPIESLREIVQSIQYSMHVYQQIKYNLPDELTEDEDDEEIVYEKTEDLIRTSKYATQVMSCDCESVLEPDSDENYYSVVWDEPFEEFWRNDEVLSAQGLAWLSENPGQYFMEAIENTVRAAIDDLKQSVNIDFYWEDSRWNTVLQRRRHFGVPYPDQVVALLRALKFKATASKEVNREIQITIEW
jgi:hypothetical protein